MKAAEQKILFDVIVIGAGIGGLFAAAKLAKEGKKVLVLEQHSIPGGYATTFRRKGYMFEAGIHAIDGFYDPENPNLKFFREIGVMDNINFLRLPEFYSVKRGTFNVTIRDEMKRFKKEIHKSFPNNKKQAHTFFHVLSRLRKEIVAFPTNRRKMLFSLPLAPFKFPLILKNIFNTLGKFMDRLTDNDDLKIALTANTGYYHTDPYSYSLLHYGGAQGSYLTGGSAYIQGGSKKLTGYLVKYLRKHGCTVLFNQSVKKIIVKNKQVTGVISKNGKIPFETFHAKYIVANAPIPSVINKMLPNLTSRKLRKRLKNYTISHSVFCLYFGLKKPLKDFGSNNYSTFILPKELTKFRNMSKYNTTDDFSKKILALVDYSFIDARLTKDNRATATCAVIDEIDQWENLDKEAYKKKKEECCQEIISRLEESYPGFRDNIDYYEGATPKTMERYTGNPRGCIYGYEQSPNQIGPKRPDQFSGIKGLYFASAWSKPGGGITAAAKCGNVAAKEILKKIN